MNYIIKHGRNFIAISNKIEADRHKHWLIQMFLSSQKEINIEVKGQHVTCSAILVNINIPHTFNTEGKPHFTMLIDPTTKLGRAMKILLMKQSFYIFPHEKTVAMQQKFQSILIQRCHNDIQSFIQTIISQFSYSNLNNFDDRVNKVLNLLDRYVHKGEFRQINYFSKKANLSESRLGHLFKEETDIPLKSYIVLRKLQKAYELIFNGENITTAALSAGFDSPSHLAYTNKMMTGMSATSIIKDSEFLKVF